MQRTGSMAAKQSWRERCARIVTAGGLAALSLALTTCNLDSLFQSPRSPHVEIRLEGDTVAVQDSIPLAATVLVDNKERAGLPLVWTSSDVAIAGVRGSSDTGVVRGLARGAAEVSVRLPPSALGTVDVEGRGTVRVIAASVTVAPGDTVLRSVGDTLCYRRSALDARGGTLPDTTPALRIISDPDATIQLVDKPQAKPECVGVVARKSGAAATIRASLDTSSADAAVTVQQRVHTIEIPVERDTLVGLGATRSYQATPKDRRANLVPIATIAWTSSDAGVVTVDATGQVTARGEGTAFVRARADDGADSVEVTVTPPRLVVAPEAVRATATRENTRKRDVKVAIGNTGTGTLNWTATGAGEWLSLSKTEGTASGTVPDTIVFQFDPTGLAAGTYQRPVIITAPGAAGSPDTVPTTFVISPPTAPDAPQALTQLKLDGLTLLSAGAITDEAGVMLRAQLADPDEDASLVLELELRPLGTAFTNQVTATSGAVPSGQAAAVTITGLADNSSHHWQARVRDETGRTSAWVSFGDNAEDVADFRVAVPENPTAPTALGQFQSDGTTVIDVGQQAIQTTVVFKGTGSDPDPGDRLRLEVELKRVGAAFDAIGTVLSPEVASGAQAVVTVSGIPDDANYRWRARIIDQTGRASGWSSFGGNAETAADFNVPPLAESPDVPTDPAQYQSDGSTAIAVGGIAFQSTVVLRSRLTDADPGDQLTLEVEVRPVGTAFTNAATHTGTPVTSGAIASLTVSGLSEDTEYHWQLRAVDQTSKASAWVSFGGNAESTADFKVALPEPPDAPTVLRQFRSNGTDSIPRGTTIGERTVVFRANVTDPDPGDQIRLEVEAKPLGTGFDGSGATLGPSVSSGSTASATISNQSDDTSYHWRVRTVDQTNRTSAWISYGANAETDIDYRIVVPEPPADPASLGQFKSNGTTAIGNGATTDEATVVLKATISDPDPTDQVRLDLEVRPVTQSFTGTPTHSTALGAGGSVQISLGSLADNTDYHWRARARDQTDAVSAWVSFGGSDGTTDFRVAVPENPGTPSGLGQFRSDGTTPINAGETTNENTVVFKATVTDADPGDQLRLEVEVQPVGTAFTNAPTATGGTAVTSGAQASVTVGPLSDNTNYHWQVRAVDQTGRAGAWVAFGSGGTDFHVSVPGAPDAPASLQQFKSDGSTVITGGSTTNEKTVVFKATVSDAEDPGELVRLEVEVKPAAAGFNGSNTVSSDLGPNPGTATVTVTNLSDDTDYHWRARTVDQNNNAGTWVEFPAAGTDFRVQVPEPPTIAAPAQFKSDGSTSIATGAATDENTVRLQAAISDPDPGDQVRLDLEVRPTGEAFTGVATHSSPLGAGGTVQFTVGSLSDDIAYHWRARARDQSDAVSAWISFGGNADGATDFEVSVPEPPDVPASLGQFKSNGNTSIPAGDPTDESTVVLKATLSDPDPGNQVRLDLEVRPVGQAFTGTPTHSGSLGAAGVAQVTVSGLSDDTDYHWRARTRDQTERTSLWVSFGGTDGTADFRVAVPQDPTAPTGLGQFKSDGTTPIATGAITDQTTVVFKATLTDPDPGAQLKLEIERELVGTDFDGSGTDSSTAVASGATASITVAGHTENAAYHWRARTRDQTGRTSAWVSFDVNAETAPDFRVNAVAENPGDPASPGQFRTNDSPITVGDATGETSVVFKATVTDVDPDAQLRIEVERKLVSQALDGTGTAISATTVASGQVASVTISGQADNSSYHWRVRTVDENNNTSGWVAFGGNLDQPAKDPADTDYRINVAAEAPNVPTGLDQFQSDGTTQIAVGGAANQTTVVFKATVSDPDPGELVRLQVEVQEAGVAFTDNPTATSSVAVASGTTASVTVGPLADNKSYHWQARTIDASNSTSLWVSFGGNAEPGGVDFQLPGVPEPPGAPTGLGQFKMDAATAISLNTRTDQDSVVFKATVADADPGALIRLEVEVKPIGAAFTGTGTVVGTTAVTTGNVAEVTVLDLGDNTSYHWRARACDEVDSLGPWVSFGGNSDGNPPGTPAEADFHVDQVLQAPANPTGLGQFKSDGSTAVVEGATTDQSTLVFKAAVSDPDPASQLRLQVEIKPLGTDFDGTVTGTSASAVASGAIATVTVSGQGDNTSYHWRARAIDQDNQPGGWVSFPESGNAETAVDYRIEVPEPPVAPASLAQFKSNGSTSIGTGATTDEATVVFQASISDPDPGQQMRVDLEVRPIGVAFTGTPTHSGALGAGGTVQVSVSGLTDDTNFHWRARSRDASDNASSWVSFGGNADGVTDFSVAVPQNPNVPGELKQFRSGGADSIPVADTAFTGTVVLRARLTDPDPAAQIRLWVEWQPVGTAFNNSPRDSSGVVNSNDTAVVTLTNLSDDVSYHWQVKAKDQTGRESAWVPYGGNADPDGVDFRVWIPENPSAPTAAAQLKSDGSTSISVGGVTNETSVIFRAGVTDPDPGDSIRLHVELRPIGTPFTNTETHVGSLAPSAGTATVTAAMLTENTGYHWQVRSADKRGNKSIWLQFGANTESTADFSVNAVAQDPAPPPDNLGQFQSDGTTAIAVGGNAQDGLDSAVVVFKARVFDPDPGDSLVIQIEARKVGTDFTGAPTHTGTIKVGNDGTASLTAKFARPALLSTDEYHWQARTLDQTGRWSAWQPFGGNPETAADFKVAGVI